MKVSSRNIKIIKNRLERLYNEFNINPLDKSDEVRIGDDGVFIDFPNDSFGETISVDDFLYYTNDLDGIIKEEDSTVRMGPVRQTILNVEGFLFESCVSEVSYQDNFLIVNIVQHPILIGLYASKEGIYDEDMVFHLVHYIQPLSCDINQIEDILKK